MFSQASQKYASKNDQAVERFAAALERDGRIGIADTVRRAYRDMDLAWLRRLAGSYGGQDLLRDLEDE